MKNIRLTLTDGDTIETKINGTRAEIYSHYTQNNFFASCSKENIPQVKSITFIGYESTGFTGCKESEIVASFEDGFYRFV